MNVVRKHVSRIKGGRLALAAAPARVVSLIVSDIPGDIPSLVASGPTVPDAGTPEMARAVVEAYGLALPPAVLAHLASPACAAPDPADPAFARNEVHLIASAAISLEAAQAAAARRTASPRSSSPTPSRARRARSAASTPRSPARSPPATARSPAR